MAINIRDIVLGVLETCAIASCAWGIWYTYDFASSGSKTVFLLSLIYNSLWFIFGIGANLSGLISIFCFQYETRPDYYWGNYFLRVHYLLSWISVIIGYPSFVCNTWMSYTGSYYPLMHYALSVIPLMAWIEQKGQEIVFTTQAITIFTLLSHFYICYLARNVYGLIGSIIMCMNIIALSLPTRHSLAGITSRETFIVGLAVTSYFLSLAAEEMVKHPTKVKRFVPWR